MVNIPNVLIYVYLHGSSVLWDENLNVSYLIHVHVLS